MSRETEQHQGAVVDDRELLELAAKAAGIEGLTWRNHSACFYYDDPETGREQWSPLTRDGQALRVAVKLGMNLWMCNPVAMSVEIPPQAEDDKIVEKVQINRNDPAAAVRRAIVRAAAEIGRTM